jgi:tRNA-splicing ligase RtcB
MSLKFSAQKVSSNHYILPRTGTMRVAAHAFLSEALYDDSEESLWLQIANGASYAGVTGTYLMPDCHAGFGVPIGCVLVTDGTLIQAGSGYDISCGISHIKIPGITVENIVDKDIRKKWITEVEKRVSTGIGSAHPQEATLSLSSIDDVLRFGAKALGVPSSLCERQYIPVPKDLDLTRISKAYAKALPKFGSLGSGNHYIELQAAEDGSVWVMVHTGSRGYGWQIAEYYFYRGAELRGLAPQRREDSWLLANEDLGHEYWAYHNTAANYAIANRFAIAEAIKVAVQETFKVDTDFFYDISHNLIQEETLVLPDGSHKKGFVHRKGATRAFPAGHPDLSGTSWESTGHPILTPGSMYDGAAILFPSKGAYSTCCSVNHGSGRLLGRGQAKRSLSSVQELIDEEMSEVVRTFGGVEVKGIVSNQPKIPLDECRHVYKSLDAVLGVLQEENITTLHKRLWPIANIKGSD